jgi:integrase
MVIMVGSLSSGYDARAQLPGVNPTKESTQEANRPIDKIRIGNVTASIWRNPSEKGDFYTTTFERSYKDETGALKNSQSFPRGDLLELAKIDTSSLTGLRDRALIAVMVYTFARVGAVLQMNVGDYFSQGRRGWVRLPEKGGKEHEAPCIPKLETYLDE